MVERTIPWTHPVELSASTRGRVELEVERLTRQVISRWDQSPVPMGLIHGKTGLAFSLFELGALGVPRAQEFAERALEEAVDQFNTSGGDPGLHHGTAGLGWLLDAWLEEEPWCQAIDERLQAHVTATTDREPNMGLRAGLAGIGLYAARRAHRAPSARALLDAVSHQVQRAAHQTPRGLVWNTPAAYWRARGGAQLHAGDVHNLRECGVAHGSAPVALLVALVECLRSSPPTKAAAALEGVWSAAKPGENRFGWATSDEGTAALSPTTWCTGDVGVALTSWLAARVAQLPQSLQRSLELGHALASRIVAGHRPGLESRLDLCCGLAGVGQVFACWAAMTGDAHFAEATRTTVERLLLELSAAELESLPIGLQFGLSGIASTLGALASGKKPSWTATFAMALP